MNANFRSLALSISAIAALSLTTPAMANFQLNTGADCSVQRFIATSDLTKTSVNNYGDRGWFGANSARFVCPFISSDALGLLSGRQGGMSVTPKVRVSISSGTISCSVCYLNGQNGRYCTQTDTRSTTTSGELTFPTRTWSVYNAYPVLYCDMPAGGDLNYHNQIQSYSLSVY